MGYRYLQDSNLRFLLENTGLYLTVYDNASKLDVYSEMIRAIKTRKVSPLFKLYLLNYDESIREDVTRYMLDGGSLNINFQNGIRRNANITLDNSDKKWNPSPITGYLWKDSKFRIDLGMSLKSGEVWFQAGIFVINDPSLINEQNSKNVSLQLSDKFATIDGSLGGKIINTVEIPLSSNIKEAYDALLKQERMSNIPYDVKPLRFPPKYNDITTAYTITKTDETTVGEIGIELAEMLSCDIYYDNFGYPVFEEGNYTLDIADSDVIWDFDENDMECISSSMNVNFSKVHNVVTVIGANINGDLISYTAQNENPRSPSNINVLEPNPLRIKDENIYSDDLARQRSEYELFKQGLLPLSFNFKCPFMPFLDVNKIVTVSNDFYGFKNTPFLINSVSIPLSQASNDISLTMSNISEVVLR